MSKAGKLTSEGDKSTLTTTRKDGESDELTKARRTLAPGVRHARVARFTSERMFGDAYTVSIDDSAAILDEVMKAAESGDMGTSSELLAAQSIALDTLFTELVRRSLANMGQYPDAADRYMRLALRAQSNARTTIEVLAKMHQPREQIVKHVHVNDGGQAVVAEEFHHHGGGGQDAKVDEQSHAAGAASESPALLSPDAGGNGVPIASAKGQAAMQDARRHESRRA